MPAIIVESGKDKGRVIPLTGFPVLMFGRNEHCQIVFDDYLASRAHFVVDSQSGQYLLIDQQTLNGTFLNGRRIGAAAMSYGDSILAGETMFSFVSDEESSPKGSLFGQVINDYKIERRLGRGTMGTVFLAEKEMLGRKVALKLLTSKTPNPRILDHFYYESLTADLLEHANLITVFSFGESNGFHHIASEYLEYGNLQEHLDRLYRLLPEQLVPVVLDVCTALEFIQSQGAVHRDVHPENIYIDRGGRAKLGGLRSVHFFRSQHQPFYQRTLHYMPPEQLAGRLLDISADIYSLGATMYFALSRTHPFEGKSGTEIYQKQLSTEPVALSQTDGIPARVCDLISSMLDRDPDSRPTISTIRGVLEKAAEEKPEDTGEKAKGMYEATAFRTSATIATKAVRGIRPAPPLPENLRVLIVDDQKTAQLISTKSCTEVGCQCAAVSSGVEALAHLETSKVDIVLTDRLMPEMNGDELAMQIREKYPELPIVMLTSIGTQMLTEGCTPECVDYVLAKPTTNERIEMAFANALSGHSIRGQRPGT
ncbi:MAG: protein kinase [Planctomycetota bacterium]|nr:protein kinase [Planctomycetota bacterium]